MKGSWSFYYTRYDTTYNHGGTEDNYYEITLTGLSYGEDYWCKALKGWFEGEVYNYVSGESSQFTWNPLDPEDIRRDIEVSGPDPGKK